jgi:hypothetical protein
MVDPQHRVRVIRDGGRRRQLVPAKSALPRERPTIVSGPHVAKSHVWTAPLGGWFTDALETGAYRIGHGPKVQRFSKGRVSERGD